MDLIQCWCLPESQPIGPNRMAFCALQKVQESTEGIRLSKTDWWAEIRVFTKCDAYPIISCTIYWETSVLGLVIWYLKKRQVNRSILPEELMKNIFITVAQLLTLNYGQAYTKWYILGPSSHLDLSQPTTWWFTTSLRSQMLPRPSPGIKTHSFRPTSSFRARSVSSRFQRLFLQATMWPGGLSIFWSRGFFCPLQQW